MTLSSMEQKVKTSKGSLIIEGSTLYEINFIIEKKKEVKDFFLKAYCRLEDSLTSFHRDLSKESIGVLIDTDNNYGNANDESQNKVCIGFSNNGERTLEYEEFRNLVIKGCIVFARYVFEEVPIVIAFQENHSSSLIDIIEGGNIDEKFERACYIARRYAQLEGDAYKKQLELEIAKGNFFDFAIMKRAAEQALSCQISDEVIEAFLAIQNGCFAEKYESIPPSNCIFSQEFYGISLIKACNIHDDIKGIKLLIDKRININGNGRNVLLESCSKGHILIVQSLIEKGVKVKNDDISYLYAACSNGHIDIARLLIQNGVDVKKYGGSSLIVACSKGHIDIINLLIENEVNIKKSGGSALVEACSNGDINIVKLLIEKGANVNAIDEMGRRSLIEACSKGYIDIIYLLLEYGANVEMTDGFGKFPLIEACSNGHIDIANLLLAKGANINKADLFKISSLIEACANGHKEIVELLIKKGADIKRDGYEALVKSVSNNFIDIVKLLIDNGVNVRSRSVSYIACSNGNKEMVKFLINKGAYVNSHNNNMQSALSIACSKGYKDIAQLLIEKGANINDKDFRGYTPLMFACLHGNTDIVKLLVDNGAEVSTKGSFSSTPMSIVSCYAGFDILSFLSLYASRQEVVDSIAKLSSNRYITYSQIYELIVHNVTVCGSFDGAYIDYYYIQDPDIIALLLDNGCRINRSKYCDIPKGVEQRLWRFCDVGIMEGTCIFINYT